MKRPPTWLVLGGLFGLALLYPKVALGAGVDCASMPCAEVLPGASQFEPVEGAPYAVGKDAAGEVVGWIARSTDVVDIKAYSSKPLVTLIGLDTRGIIVGARLLGHSEPILLVGIPEKVLHDFIAEYVGLPATTQVVVGHSSDADAVAVDIISGATVTALAQNQTILKTARTVGVNVGVIEAAAANPGHFVVDEETWSWAEMERRGVFGRLTVTEKEMGVPDAEGNFIDLWFTIADAPQVGRALLGERTYGHVMKSLAPGEHLLVILGNGSSSFRGSAFVRGGQFDRVRVTQGMREMIFRDTDYRRLPGAAAEDAPAFQEGAVFTVRDGALDPGASFTLVFLGSRYDRRGGFTRDFREFTARHRLPGSVYYTAGSSLDEPMYVQAWRNRKIDVIVVGVILLLVGGVFAARRWTTADPKRIKRLHLASMIVSLLVLGVYFHAQPSVTQMLTLIGSVVGEWRWDLFASAPLIFIFWIFIAITTLIWGRGVFCGWLCPYGAGSELLFKLAGKLGIRQWDIRQTRWSYVRYGVLALLVITFLYSAELGEKLAEIEPFKTSFLVPFWTREFLFVAWWVVLVTAAIFLFRPFCRYLCPLGAGLALLSTFRLSGPRRRQFCSSCTICTKGCEPAAIRADGTIDPRECLSCMDCEATYRNEEVCPPLVGIDRLMHKVNRTPRDEEKLIELQRAKRDV